MKRKLLLSILLLVFLLPTQSVKAESSSVPILFTYYRQMGWGDRVEIGYLDDKGNCWILKGSDSDLEWPFNAEEQIQFLQNHDFEKTGTLKFDDLFALKSLISSVKASDGKSQPAANDAGTERTYAVRYDRDGTADPILLGMSGDDMFENTDYNAQGLYLAARSLFPEVTAYGGDMGPSGFVPIRITEFCNLGDLNGATVHAVYNDCEEGSIEIDLSRSEQREILNLIGNGYVTGKVNAIGTTGDFRTYSFYRGDQYLGFVDICGDLLYASDGMYSISADLDSK